MEAGALQAALPAYEVGQELGRGAFGVVYAARHAQLDRHVAVKVLPQVFATDRTVRERFVAEAQMVASLDHPHIVPVYDYVEDDHACMLIMERCAASVGDRFKEHGVATDEACAAVLACLAALDLAHERGVLHRDVKPENLMLDKKGVVKLADFGIARALDTEVRHTKTGMIIGTPAYMSPEQVRGDELGAASDVYSAATMAYELLSGTLPFPATPSAIELLTHHLSTQPLPLVSARPELPGAVGAVIDRALSKSLDDRHATAAEFATELSGACVRSFGSGWLRRRGFTLHWPDMVAENERPSSGKSAGTTDTITVQALNKPHEVIGPEDALAAWSDTLLGARAQATDNATPPAPPPPSPTPPPARPAQPDSAWATAHQPSPPAPAPPERDRAVARADAGRNRLIWVLCSTAVVLMVAIAAFVVLSRPGSDADDTAVSNTTDDLPDDDVDEAATTVQPTQSTVEAAQPTAAPAVDAEPLSNRPNTYLPTDASEPFLPTPCPDIATEVACIHNAVEIVGGLINVSFFTERFVPSLEPGSDRVHFYFDTVVDGDETAAGAESNVAMFRPWGQPFDITQTQGDNGASMYTVADAREADARYLCIIVARANEFAVPGSGNCAPLPQVWDTPTFERQQARISGRFIGRCGLDVTAVVPNGWNAADLVLNSPTAASQQLFQGDDAEQLLTQVVDGGGVLYAVGQNVDGSDAALALSILDGDFRIGSNPGQVTTQLEALGVNVADTSEEIIGDRAVLTSSVANPTDGSVTTRYFIPDFGYVIEATVVTDSNATDIAARIADTIVGC